MRNDMTGAFLRALLVLLAAVGILFLAGCINLANLLLARAANRIQEFSLRASLGATRSRLARQCFGEAMPLLPPSMPRIGEIGLHGPVLAMSIVLSVVAALLVALAPAAQVRSSLLRG